MKVLSYGARSELVDFEDAYKEVQTRAPEFTAHFYTAANLESERRLLMEILIDAIDCWQALAVGFRVENATRLRGRLYREAHFWIFGEYDNTPFFSFAQICDCLGLNPDFLRRRLLQWRQKRRATSSPLPHEAIFSTSTNKAEVI